MQIFWALESVFSLDIKDNLTILVRFGHFITNTLNNILENTEYYEEEAEIHEQNLLYCISLPDLKMIVMEEQRLVEKRERKKKTIYLKL